MSDFVWLLPAEKASAFGSSGVSSGYLVPQNVLKLAPENLIQKRLWFVLRGQEDRLFKAIKIKSVERIVEGYHTGDFLVTPIITESFKLSANYASSLYLKTDAVKHLDFGVSEIDSQIGVGFIEIVKSHIQVKLVPPDHKLIEPLKFDVLTKNSHHLVKSALASIISRFSLEQIWANGSGLRLGAFANFANSLLKEKLSTVDVSDLTKQLSALDPIQQLSQPSLNRHESNKNLTNKPSVDTEFTPINPDRIFAREFLFKKKSTDFEAAIEKTENAEKQHQSMLKDIVLYLISRGFTPYESSSVDLFYQAVGRSIFVEIKSATAVNIMAQAAKGTFQLACYWFELSKIYENLVPILILQKTENDAIESFIKEALQNIGITVLFYDPLKTWPDRVPFLPI
mgnify:CR=1 FL=1